MVYQISQEGIKEISEKINYTEKMVFLVDETGNFTGILIEYREKVEFNPPKEVLKTKFIK